MNQARVLAVAVVSSALFSLAACSGGGSVGATASIPSAGVYVGVVIDEDGQPVAGATVSVAGVEATAVTDASGNFTVDDSSLAVPEPAITSSSAVAAAVSLEATVVAPGYEPAVVGLSVAEGERVNIGIVRSGLAPSLALTAPTGDKVLVVPTDCSEPRVLVEGFAKLAPTESFRLDLVMVVDRSGSTNREAFDVDEDGLADSVLDAELAAASCLIQTLDPDITRVAIVQFNDNADVVHAFSGEIGDAADAISQVGPPSGGTNYEAAFAAARDVLVDLAVDDDANHEPAEDPAPDLPDPHRVIVFLSDGIPTSHGVPRDLDDSNLTQSSADRSAAIEAAKELGLWTGAELFAFSIIPKNDTNLTRTTLPHCVAVCGGGAYRNVADPIALQEAVCGQSLVSQLRVELVNVTSGSDPIEAELFPDGFFSELVPVSLAAGVPAAIRTVENTIDVTLTAFSGELALQASQSVVVRLISEDDIRGKSAEAVIATQSAPLPVSEMPFIARPLGGAISRASLRNFLLGEYEDAVELFGVETFRVLDPVGAGGSVTLRVDFVFKQACYKSDFGYIVVDPENLPRKAKNALADVSSENILFNSGDVGQSSCSLQSIPAGTATFDVELEDGQVLVFFILPNRTLEQYRASPKRSPAPLFTMPSLNPGGFAQVLAFRSLLGRTAPGADDDTVITDGPLTVFAFEDLSIAKGSDQDFTDVVFSVTNVLGRVDTLECE